jgi:transcriptional regulator with XRE-family HTH domain
MDEAISFGRWLKQRRRALDLTQEELAGKAGCARITIQKIEAEERRPSRVTAERLAICLGIPSSTHAAFITAARAGLRPSYALSSREMVGTEVDTSLNWNHIIAGLKALQQGDFAPHLPPQPPGSLAAVVVDTYNGLHAHLTIVTAALTRVMREVGYDSRLGSQAEVPNLEGRWRDLQDDINQMSTILTHQIRAIANTTRALAQGVEAPPLVLDGRGEIASIQEAINQIAKHCIFSKTGGGVR